MQKVTNQIPSLSPEYILEAWLDYFKDIDRSLRYLTFLWCVCVRADIFILNTRMNHFV